MLRPGVESLGYELVGIEYQRGGRRGLLRIYIDAEAGVTVEDCERVSYQVSGVLDVEDPIPDGYTLEVSSPGLDRPLFSPRDYERFRGAAVRVRTRMAVEGRKNFSGTLEGHRDGSLVLSDEDGERLLPFEAIASTRLIPDL
jgi:ribosome maturation factor RimP